MTAIFITARLKSTRLKSKVLKEVNGKSILQYQVERLQHNFNSKIIICTSNEQNDDPLEELSKTLNVEIFRGSKDNVIKRYYDCCKQLSITKFFVVYGDEPFTCYRAINTTFDLLNSNQNKKVLIMNNHLPVGTFGYGFTFEAITEMFNKNKIENTEVWGPLLKNTDIKIIHNPYFRKDKIYDLTRLTIDYLEDMQVFKAIIEHVGDKFKSITLEELVDIYWKLNLNLINGNKIKEYQARLTEQSLVFDV